jgi:hypothetical protein
MSKVKSTVPGAILEWHSIEEIPPLQTVEYDGETWLQSKPLLLASATGKMAVGYCQQGEDGRPQFEAGVSETLPNVSFWAMVQTPFRR